MKIQKYMPYILIFIITLSLDIITKLVIKSKLMYGDLIPVIDGFFNIVYVLNPGAAFGFLGNLNDSYRQVFFVIITLIMIGIVVFIMRDEKSKVAIFGYTLILSGAVGNLIDRVHTGKVVDFLDFRLGSYAWPAFNVADICITTGVGLLILQIIFMKKEDEENKSTRGSIDE